ncbi:MAG: metallophosphoesterase [Thermoplasmata archaeon]
MPNGASPSRDAGILSPAEILRLSSVEVDRMIDRLEATVPEMPAWADLGRTGAREALVMGDTHGDWPSVVSVVDRFLAGESLALVGLGDYVDRTPADCPLGSAANALYLLQVAASNSPRVVLIRGNHETVDRIPVAPRSLEPEIERAWGVSKVRAQRIVRLLNRGPIAATSPSGAYLAHGGFPRSPRPDPWTRAVDPQSLVRLAEIAWADCSASRNRRSVAAPFDGEETREFLAEAHLSVFVRGHDPDITGKVLFDGRCITLHTTRYYARYGGVIAARLPLLGALQTVDELPIEEVPDSRVPR